MKLHQLLSVSLKFLRLWEFCGSAFLLIRERGSTVFLGESIKFREFLPTSGTPFFENKIVFNSKSAQVEISLNLCRRYLVQISARTPIILTEICRDFYQCLQVSVWRVTQSALRLLGVTYFIIHYAILSINLTQYKLLTAGDVK
jgi:hypothetical protein